MPLAGFEPAIQRTSAQGPRLRPRGHRIGSEIFSTIYLVIRPPWLGHQNLVSKNIKEEFYELLSIPYAPFLLRTQKSTGYILSAWVGHLDWAPMLFP
jgi:hypothetical protein